MTLGQRIAQFRKTKGLSQEALAELVGVSRQAVSKWELDEAQPDAGKLVLLARALEVSTDQLLLGDESGQSADPNASTPPDAPQPVSPAPAPDYPAALGRFVKKHGYKAGYILIAWGLALLLFAGAGFGLFHGFFTAADESLQGFISGDIFSGWDDHSGVQFQAAPGVSLSPDEIAAIEEALAGEHHIDEHDPGGLATTQVEIHAFPLGVQRAMYGVLAIPALMGVALIVTGVVVIVKFKRREV